MIATRLRWWLIGFAALALLVSAYIAAAAAYWCSSCCLKLEVDELVGDVLDSRLAHRHKGEQPWQQRLGDAAEPVARLLRIDRVPTPPDVAAQLRSAKAYVATTWQVDVTRVAAWGPWCAVDIADGRHLTVIRDDAGAWSFVDEF